MVEDQLKLFLKEHQNKREDWISENLSNLFVFITNSSEDNIQWKEKLYRYLNNIIFTPHCYCGKDLEFQGRTKGYRKYCSTKCQSNSSETKDKRKSTLIEKYGVDNPMKSIEIKNTYDRSILEKYGVSNISQFDLVKQNVRKSNNLKFGVDYVSQLPEIRESLSKKMKLKSNELNFLQKDNLKKYLIDKSQNLDIQFQDILDTSMYSFVCSDSHQFSIHKNTLNDRIKYRNTICTICNPIDSQSDSEKNLLKFIQSLYSGKIETNVRGTIKGEIDIFLPEINMGFEYNGVYWHSDVYKDPKYHLNKTNECHQKGIKLIHIWEDDWMFKSEIVKSRISNLLGSSRKIWARKCVIREITYNLMNDFLNENHIQGSCVSKINLGIFYQNNLMGVMSFGSLRKSLGQRSIEGSYEMLRFCSKIGISIVGGASKLFNYFLRNYHPLNIISYADRSWSDGALYRRLGFSLDHETGPNYYWVVNGVRKNRFNFRKDKLVKEGYDSNKSESEIMKDLGYHKIYDSGSYKFSFQVKIM